MQPHAKKDGFLSYHFIDCNIDTHVFELTGIWFSFENTDNTLLNVAISDGYEVADTPIAIIRENYFFNSLNLKLPLFCWRFAT